MERKYNMTRSMNILLLVCLSFGVLQGAEAADEGISPLADHNNAFALDLYHQLNRKEGNLFLSPYSIASAFAVCYAGARGNTMQEMSTVMHFPEEHEPLHAQFEALNQGLNEVQKKGHVELIIANSLWAQYDYPFLPEYRAITEEYYHAKMENVDFKQDTENSRRKINTWTEEKTHHLIKDMIPEGVLSPASTKLVLASAIYFKGEWAESFENKDTKEMPFWVTERQSRNVPLMCQQADFEYAEDDDTQVLLLPYKGKDLSMVILLPKTKDGIRELEDHLTMDRIHQWLAATRRQEILVYLPKFTIESSFGLKEYLTAMGMRDAFLWPGANFSGMDGTDLLYISKALHKAWVKVDEKGTEAAAATAVMMTLGAAPGQPPKIFRADHPFLFFIKETASGSILFMGRLSNPT